MSAPVEEISDVTGSNCHVCPCGDDDEYEAFSGVHARKDDGKKDRGYGFGRDITAKAKRVVPHRFRKAEKRKRALSSSSSSSWSSSVMQVDIQVRRFLIELAGQVATFVLRNHKCWNHLPGLRQAILLTQTLLLLC